MAEEQPRYPGHTPETARMYHLDPDKGFEGHDLEADECPDGDCKRLRSKDGIGIDGPKGTIPPCRYCGATPHIVDSDWGDYDYGHKSRYPAFFWVACPNGDWADMTTWG